MTVVGRSDNRTSRGRVAAPAVVLVVVAALVATGAPVAAEAPQPNRQPDVQAPEMHGPDVQQPTVPGSFVVRTDGPADAGQRRAIAAEVDGEPGLVVAPDTFVVDVGRGPAASAQVDALVDEGLAVEVQAQLVYTAADVEPGDTCWRGDACVGVDGTPSFGGQVELRDVGAPRAWELTKGSADVVVAVLDTLIETSPPHRDLAGKLLEGRSFVADRTCTGDGSARDHGTIAAGLIAAQPDNGIDIAGLGWNTKVLPVEVLDDCGAGTTAAVAAGLRWAADNGADIANLSLTGLAHDPTVSAAVAYARAKGLIVVAAAGNGMPFGNDTPVWPAADLGVVAVGATGLSGTLEQDVLAGFSNYGDWVDIVAPGVDIVGLRRTGGSTTPFDGTIRATGTSFATPIVAAAAALVVAAHPELSAEQVVARLARSAAPIPGAGSEFLWGRLDVAAALGPRPAGYRLAALDGGLFSFGDAPFAGSAAGPAASDIVGGAAHVSGRGYWLVDRVGRVRAFGAAPVLGSAQRQRSAAPVVGMAATPGGDGYWLATADGAVLAFGAAPDLGHVVGPALSRPIVGIAASPRGIGFWLVAGDGGVFAFGDAPFLGSAGATALNEPIVGMAAAPGGDGYWLVAGDGGIFAFGGDAPFLGSTGAIALNQPVVGMAAPGEGDGYWLVARDGGIFAFGDAPFLGSTGAIALNEPIVAMLNP